jgi:uncharacterized protein (DUF1684 family)
MQHRRCSILLFSCVVGVAAACRPPNPIDEDDYVTRIAEMRAAKDREFQQADDPIPADRKARFLPLPYYPIDPTYAVPAELKPSPESPTLMMVTSTGTQEAMRRAGQLEFILRGQPLKLTAFVPAAAPDMDQLFVPFSDLTGGTETYPAGRYLDLQRRSTGVYQIDFNIAYNPYCYYNPTYICPLPPVENRLQVRVEAGERIGEK